MKNIYKAMLAAVAMCAMGCTGGQTQTQAADAQSQRQAVPTFDADTAYAYVAAQTSFGPRVPGTQASRDCAAWLVGKLREHGASDITEQRGQVTAYNGDRLDICNITARLNPQATKRILLLAHYDSRPWADQESDPVLRMQPIDGANDGASGVGVILEVARQISKQTPTVGVDILLVDAEDYGRRSDDPAGDGNDDSWCLGTQYWVEQPTLDLQSIDHAILLDMVGGKNAVFPREYFSDYAAHDLNDRVRKAARAAGHGDRFPEILGTAVVDDHVYLNTVGLRAIDIIEVVPDANMAFNATWHTHADNLSNIDPATLAAVGQTLLQYIY